MDVDKIYCADNVGVLRSLPSNSIDAVVTDPPYGISFMNSRWDYDVPTKYFWRDVYRVLKPGGYVLSACGTRTYHRAAAAIEDAGFDICDVVSWLYGSGFPKGMEAGKALDYALGCSPRFVGKKRAGMGTEEAYGMRHIGENTDKTQNSGIVDVTEPVSEIGRQYHKWNTALKPAQELFTLAQKPCSEETTALNALKWGTGFMNIPACAVEADAVEADADEVAAANNKDAANKWTIRKPSTVMFAGSLRPPRRLSHGGRYPANVIHDGSEEVLGLFPTTPTTGGGRRDEIGKRTYFKTRASANVVPSAMRNQLGIDGKQHWDEERQDWYIFQPAHSDPGGSAARYFYCAKASPNERNFGLEEFEYGIKAMGNQAQAELKRGNDPTVTVNNISLGITKAKNTHPTVKPIKLMRYLIRLITPPDGIVLDPFAGSGTTAIAAVLEGFHYLAIEKELKYFYIAEARVKAWRDEMLAGRVK